MEIKEKLSHVAGFEDFSRARRHDSAEVYINHLAYFVNNEGRELGIDSALKAEIEEAHNLLGFAKDNLANARYELEEVNKELLRWAK